MNIGTELEKLNELRRTGVLTDHEFDQAKKKLLDHLESGKKMGGGVQIVGDEAHNYVHIKIVYTVIGAVLTVVVLFAFFLPRYIRLEAENEQFKQEAESDIQVQPVSPQQNHK